MFNFGDCVKYDVDEAYGVAYIIGNMKLADSDQQIPVIANTSFIGMPINQVFLTLVESGYFDIAQTLRQRYENNFGELA